jgi:MSHA biogenesis protein MshK
LSSILKALKKIEEESPPPEAFPSLPQPIDSRKAINSKAQKRRRVRRTLTILFIVAVLAVAAGILFSQRRMIVAKIWPPAAPSNRSGRAAVTPPANKVYKAKITAAPGNSVQQRPAQNRQPKNPIKSPKTRPPVNKSQAAKSTFPTGAAAGQRESKSSSLKALSPPGPDEKAQLNANVEKPLKKTPTPMSATPAEKSVPRNANVPIEPAAAAPVKPARTPAKVTYDRIADSKLKLQALAWSADDARRMAVINGRIVREGESVDGYQVMQIREEDVVVNDGGKSWRLEFGMQR